jgi:uncharacterized secreted protein with C-terminal beta-propeller domain
MNKNRIAAVCSVLGLLAGCSGGDSVELVAPRPSSVPNINEAQPFAGPLKKLNAKQASRFIQNGIYAATEHPYSLPTPAPAAAAESDKSFSVTNTQESGVDEADRIEYDGDYLYLAAYPQWIEGDEYQSQVRVLKRNSDFSLTEVNSLTLDDDNSNIDGMYLTKQRLAVVNSSSPIYTINTLVAEPWNYFKHKVGVSVYDVSSPEQDNVLSKVEIDGSLLSSRRIEDQLYVVSSFVPTVENLTPGVTTKEEMLKNYLAIIDTPTNELMPKITVAGNTNAMNQPEDCLFPADATENDGYAQILTVTRINMQQPNDISSVCFGVYADMLYMSEQNMYLASTVMYQTALHKIALDTQMTYQASGTIDGILGRSSSPNLRISEKDNYLRVVSSDYQNPAPVHRLSVLQQQGSSLSTVATLPNKENPEVIGKPGEDVYAVRFFGERAYVVTFVRKDPLYVLDLSNPNAPVIAGSLEIPGFSSYLHPLDNGYLLGVGQQVSVQEIPETGTIPIDPPTPSGIKVSLFDVSDPAAPREINSVIKENGYTPVEYDYKALSVLNNNGMYQFAMPIEQWGLGGDDIQSDRYWAPINSLLMLEVDTQSSGASLTQLNQLSVENAQDAYIGGGNDRSVIHGEHVYYIHGNQVWHSLWQQNALADGPY